jgi:hypothetical protein
VSLSTMDMRHTRRLTSISAVQILPNLTSTIYKESCLQTTFDHVNIPLGCTMPEYSIVERMLSWQWGWWKSFNRSPVSSITFIIYHDSEPALFVTQRPYQGNSHRVMEETRFLLHCHDVWSWLMLEEWVSTSRSCRRHWVRFQVILSDDELSICSCVAQMWIPRHVSVRLQGTTKCYIDQTRVFCHLKLSRRLDIYSNGTKWSFADSINK